MVRRSRMIPLSGRLADMALTIFGSIGLTVACFLVLPLMQTISKPPDADALVRQVDSAALPPPPPPVEPPEKQEEQQEEKPPELQPEAKPLDLSQMELALDPGVVGGWLQGDFGMKVENIAANAQVGGGVDALFSVADLDQQPRVVYQPGASLDAKARRKAPGTVHIVFLVDEEGHVQQPIVQSSTDPVFERPARDAVKQWRFEPGKRNGKPVRFRMRVPITFER